MTIFNKKVVNIQIYKCIYYNKLYIVTCAHLLDNNYTNFQIKDPNSLNSISTTALITIISIDIYLILL